MRPALLAVSLALCACGGGGPGPFTPICLGPMIVNTNPAIVLSGTRVNLEFNFDTNCALPESITASVLDPTSRTVESTGSVNAYISTVSFTPTRPGRHHIVVRFNPNRGLAQTDVTVARDRSAEPGVEVPLVTLMPPVELTDAGMLTAGSVLYRLVNGRLDHVRAFDSRVYARGPYFWARDTLQVSRYVVEPSADGGVALVANPSVPLGQASNAIAPAESDAVLLSGPQQQNAAHGKLLPDGGWRFTNLPASGTTTITWQHRVGDALIRFDSFNGVECEIGVTDGGQSCSSPLPSYGSYIGGDLEGFWLADSMATTLAYRGASGTMLERPIRGGLLPGGSFPVLDVQSAHVTAHVDDGEIGFESWGGPVVAASRHTVVTRTDAGNLLIRRR